LNGCLICETCDLRDTELPQPIAEACFEIHHRTPLAALKKETETTLSDLAMLCANCHRMIHRSSPMITVEELQKRLNH
jgi:5-methylcytosine-specific restriction protein A